MTSTYEGLLLGGLGYLTGNLPQLLSSTTLAAPAASVTYTVASQFNRVMCDWRAMCNAAVTVANMQVQFNGDTASHYLWQDVQGSSSTPNANSPGAATTYIAQGNVPGTSAATDYFASGSFIVDGCIQGNTFMTVHGTSCAFVNTTTSYAGTYAGQYLAAVQLTSITLFPGSGSFTAGSQFTFYGLA